MHSKMSNSSVHTDLFTKINEKMVEISDIFYFLMMISFQGTAP
jgi:hypothetical protein